MTSRVRGDDKIAANIKAVQGVLDVNGPRFKKALKGAGRIVEAAAKKAFLFLRVLRLTKGGNKVYASPALPSNKPHIRTGLLKGSITTSNPKRGKVSVGTNVKYAKHLEPKRPFLRPALFDNKRKIEKYMSQVLGRAIRLVIR